MDRFEPARRQGGAVRIASIGVLLAMIAAGGLLLRHASYPGVVFGAAVPSTGPSASNGASAMASACAQLPALGQQRVDLMTRTIATLKADKTDLLGASDRTDAVKLTAVIKAATQLVAALKNGGDTTTLSSNLQSAETALGC